MRTVSRGPNLALAVAALLLAAGCATTPYPNDESPESTTRLIASLPAASPW